MDSAVAALRLRDAGWDVQGLFMHNWEDDDSFCSAADDYQDARAACAQLGVPLHRVNFARQYRDEVFDLFLAEHRAGRTPNPDVLCNRRIKFGVCREYARRLGAEWFATGHYARLGHADEGATLLKASNAAKDQSYFLHAVTREQLQNVLFPIGEMSKAQVRAVARQAALAVHDKPDSTGICFIGERPFREFLRQFIVDTPGPILSQDGVTMGEHRGLPFYTLGQRAGLAIGGRAGASAAPWYVAAKDAQRNALIAVQGEQHPLLFSVALSTEAMHWLCEPRSADFQATARLRHRHSDQKVRVEPQRDGTAVLHFEQPQRAATPGQYAVIYDGERCLGGAAIARTYAASDIISGEFPLRRDHGRDFSRPEVS